MVYLLLCPYLFYLSFALPHFLPLAQCTSPPRTSPFFPPINSFRDSSPCHFGPHFSPLSIHLVLHTVTLYLRTPVLPYFLCPWSDPLLYSSRISDFACATYRTTSGSTVPRPPKRLVTRASWQPTISAVPASE